MTEEDKLEPLPTHLTERQYRFLDIWGDKYKFSFDRESIAKAYVEAGYSKPNAHRNAYQVLRSSNFNRIVREIMAKKNITLETLVDKHKELLEAKHPFAPNMPDNIVQLKAFQEGMKIMGGYPIPEQKVDVRHSEEYHISIEDQEKAARTLRECIDVEIIEDGDESPGDDIPEAELPL